MSQSSTKPIQFSCWHWTWLLDCSAKMPFCTLAIHKATEVAISKQLSRKRAVAVWTAQSAVEISILYVDKCLQVANMLSFGYLMGLLETSSTETYLTHACSSWKFCPKLVICSYQFLLNVQQPLRRQHSIVYEVSHALQNFCRLNVRGIAGLAAACACPYQSFRWSQLCCGVSSAIVSWGTMQSLPFLVEMLTGFNPNSTEQFGGSTGIILG